MTPDDMARLHGLCFSHHRPWGAGEIADILRSPHAFSLHREGGFIIGNAVAGQAEVITLAVNPAQRRQGIGRALVQGFMAQARARGADSAYLEVAADNAAALALYRACGFVQTGLRRGYYRLASGAVVDGLVLSCPLLPLSPEI